MNQEQNIKKTFFVFDFISISLIFILALFFRLVYLNQYQHCPFFDSPVIDALSHYIYAQKMVAGDWLLKGLVTPRVPLYVYFLAVLMRLFSSDFFAIKTAQMILGSINCQLVYLLAKKLFGRRVGLLAGIICALYGVLIYFDAEFLSVGLTIFLNLNLLLIIFSTIEKPKPWKWLSSGIFFGICLQTSPNVILFLPLLCAYVYYFLTKQQGCHFAQADCLSEIRADGENKNSTDQQLPLTVNQKIKTNKPFSWNKTAFKPLILLCLGAFLSVLPLSLRNLIEGGEFVLLSSTIGINLYIGNNPLADGKTAAPPSRDFAYQGWQDNVWVSSIKVAQSQTNKNLNNSQVSNYWMFKTGQYIIQHPVDFTSLILRKIFYLFSAYEIPENQSIYFFRLWSSLLTVLVFSNRFISFPFGVIAPLALLGIFISWHKTNQKIMVLNCFILAHLMVMVIFFVVSRYRAVLVPYFVIYAAYAAVWLFDKLRNKNFRIFLKYGLVLLVLYIYCNLNLFGAAQDDKSRWFFNLGTAFRYKGQTAKAIKSFEQACKINPDNLDILYNVGVLDLENNQFDSALKIFEQVIAHDPADSAAYNNQGLALFKLKKYDQTILAYNKVLELDPNDLGARVNLGSAYAALGQSDQALAVFNQAILIDQQFAPVYNHRAAVYESTGQMVLAEKDYLKAIELNPDYLEAYYNLALLYKEQERNEEYKTMHLKALELMALDQQK
ncbi:MAG: tetratricopeptide repeat protein [Candidatus Omnitrophica bacterium]|nr:tetratricopeptide repeat protein [Candidatus Omnitrophota bacterium]